MPPGTTNGRHSPLVATYGADIHGAVARLRGFMQSLSDNGADRVGAGLPAKDVLDAPIRGQARSHGAEPHFLQLDIANFFNRIDRARLFELLRRRLERDAHRAPDEPRRLRPALASRLLWLCRRLLTGNAAAGARPLGAARDFARLPPHKRLINAPPGKGLPIGNLTSQFFANVYLNELDQFVKHRLKCPHYLRYVDDFVLLAPDRQLLETWRDAIRDFLRERLELELRDDGLIAPLAEGVDFLGYRVRGSHLICRPRVVGHCRESLARWRRIFAMPPTIVYGRGCTAVSPCCPCCFIRCAMASAGRPGHPCWMTQLTNGAALAAMGGRSADTLDRGQARSYRRAIIGAVRGAAPFARRWTQTFP